MIRHACILAVFVSVAAAAGDSKNADPYAEVTSRAEALEILGGPFCAMHESVCGKREFMAGQYLREHLDEAELLALFEDRRGRVVQQALWAYEEHFGHKPAVEVLRKLLAHPAPDVRVDAARALVDVAHERATLKDLEPLLKDGALLKGGSTETVADDVYGMLPFLLDAKRNDKPDADLARLRRDRSLDAARITTLRSSLFAPARRSAAAMLPLRAAVARLARPLLGEVPPVRMEPTDLAALHSVLESHDDDALQELLAHKQPILRLAALDALTPRTPSKQLVEYALSVASQPAHYSVHEEGLCFPDEFDATRVVAETVFDYLDEEGLHDLYAAADATLRRALTYAAASDPVFLRVAGTELRKAAQQGDAVALAEVGKLGGSDDLTLLLTQLRDNPRAALEGLRGHADPQVVAALRQWWQAHASDPCGFKSCGGEPALPWSEFYAVAASLGEAGDALTELPFGQPMVHDIKRAHLEKLWQVNDRRLKDRLWQEHGLIEYDDLETLYKRDPVAATAAAKRVLGHIADFEDLKPHTHWNPSGSDADGPALTPQNARRQLEEDDTYLGLVFRVALEILVKKKSPDLDNLIVQGTKQSSACCVEVFATAAALRHLPQAIDPLLARLSSTSPDYEVMAVADAVAGYGDKALDERFQSAWKPLAGARSKALQLAVAQAFVERVLAGRTEADYVD